MKQNNTLKGLYTVVNSDLYVDIHRVHHISERTGKIEMKATFYYKSNNEICRWLSPKRGTDVSLIYDVVKTFTRYNPVLKED